MKQDSIIKTQTNEKIKENILEPLPIMHALFLSFINQYPALTGYELIKTMARRSNQHVILKSGSVYSVLRKLEELKFVESEQEQEGRRKRKYSLTGTGKEELTRLRKLIRLRTKYILDLIIQE